MIFAWQGFRIEHPEDFAPSVVSGTFEAGYARLEAADKRIQLRWDKTGGNPRGALERYLAVLEKDAWKAKATFSGEITDELSYRIKSPHPARGLLTEFENRRVILEVSGSIRLYQEVTASLAVDEGHWALFGLDVRLPEELALGRAELQAGRTALTFRAKGVDLEVERWGLADRLLAQRTLETWLRGRFNWPKATCETTPEGIRLSKKGLTPSEAIAVHQPERNQIVLIKTTSRRLNYRPAWDWIVSSPEDHRLSDPTI